MNIFSVIVEKTIGLVLPAKAGPIIRSSCVLKPFSPVPTKNMIEPREIVPKPKIKHFNVNVSDEPSHRHSPI